MDPITIDTVLHVRGNIEAFAQEMKAQNIHVGLGNPPRCVVDGERWPCKTTKTRDARLANDAEAQEAP
jgi:hypothetical protein